MTEDVIGADLNAHGYFESTCANVEKAMRLGKAKLRAMSAAEQSDNSREYIDLMRAIGDYATNSAMRAASVHGEAGSRASSPVRRIRRG